MTATLASAAFTAGRSLMALNQRARLGWSSHLDRKSTRLNSSHQIISYAVFCLKKKKKIEISHIKTNNGLSSYSNFQHTTAQLTEKPEPDTYNLNVNGLDHPTIRY